MSKPKKIIKSNNVRTGKIYAILYCRVSSERQASEGHGLDSQETRCRQYASQKGYEVAEVFRDSFTGGGDFMLRPAMRELLSYVEINAFKNYVLIFDDLKRFARDVAKHWELRHIFERLGVKLESPNFEFKDNDEGAWLNETVNAVFNEYDRRTNRRQVIQKQKARLDVGYWAFASRKPYKMDKDLVHGKVLKLQYPQAQWLKEAMEGFASGKFIRKIDACKFLVEKGYWKRQTPEKYIDNFSLLCKDILFAGYIEKPEWEVSRRIGHHEALISLDTYELIQKRLKNEGLGKRIRVDISEDFPLRGLLICDSCGKHLTGAWSKGRKQRHPYYFCQNKECIYKGKSILKKDIEENFSSLLKKQVLKEKVGVIVKDVFDFVWKEEISSVKDIQFADNKKKAELKEKISKLSNFVISTNNEIVRGAYEKQIEETANELASIQDHLVGDIDISVPYRTALDKATGFLESPYKVWQKLSVIERHSLFYFIFNEKIPYDIKEGYRTNKIPSAVRLFEEFAVANSSGVEMGGIEPPCK